MQLWRTTRWLPQRLAIDPRTRSIRRYSTKNATSDDHVLDHRRIGAHQGLWTLHPHSHGSPIFTPAGSYIFQRLQQFIRAQYPCYGFEEVVTPTLYRRELWQQSGHWENYKDDMFVVCSRKTSNDAEDEFGLKPMNCPGHCLLYDHKPRSYNELPVRYADFSPLHRDEISGALTGLTRVRRFHQDDGHIFCRPDQVKAEIGSSLRFMQLVYRTLHIDDFRLVVSTRPETGYLGTAEEWQTAEQQLEEALTDFSGHGVSFQQGEGAFYGPKIDAIVQDNQGKEHQVGTIQLDFQLPRRFQLKFNAGAHGNSDVPVLIHRAILGSVERFMALLIERNAGKWPFWLNPRPVTIVTVSDNAELRNYAETIVQSLRTGGGEDPRSFFAPHYRVELDARSETLSKKIAMARERQTSVIVVIGSRNVQEDMLDVDLSHISNRARLEILLGQIKKVSINAHSSQKLSLQELQQLLRLMTDAFI